MEKCAIAQNLYCTEILTVPKKEIHGMSAPQLAGTPVLILKEGSSRSRGRDALHANIMAAQIVAEAVRSALGPKGLDKMLVDELGDACMHACRRSHRNSWNEPIHVTTQSEYSQVFNGYREEVMLYG